MDFFIYNIETYCFFFGSFITLEQVDDYVMILEYQGEINICKNSCVTSHDLLFEAMEGQMCHILSSFLILAYVQWTRVFQG